MISLFSGVFDDVVVVDLELPIVRTRTATKCTNMQNARAGRAELLFLLIKPIVLWRSRSRRRRRSCVSSLLTT